MTDREYIELIKHANAISDFCKKGDCTKCPFSRYIQNIGYSFSIACKLTDFKVKPRMWTSVESPSDIKQLG